MNGRFLLDTNIVVPFLNGDQDLRDKFAQNIEIYLPVVVLAELYYGAYNSSQRVSNIEKVEGFRDAISILDCDEFTSKIYGEVKKRLKDRGTPIPENDIWISAIAIQYGLTLVTRDNHFNHIDDLHVTKW